jgi:putative intracellular protease/amidase
MDQSSRFSRLAGRNGLAIAALALTIAQPGQSQTVRAAPSKRIIAVLVYDGVQVLDFAGAFEVFSRFNRDSVFLVSKDGRAVQTWRGMSVTPAYALSNSPKPDVIVIPGGNTATVSRDSVVLGWIRKALADSAYVLSVCSGSSILLRAGILDHRRATTFWRLQESFAKEGEPRGVHVVTDRLVVDDGRVTTAAGTGIEGALLVVGKLHGEAWRHLTALHMEVSPEPDLEATIRSQLADRNLPTALDAFLPDDAELLDYSGGRDSWNQHWRFRTGDAVSNLAPKVRAALEADSQWRTVAAQTGSPSESRWRFTGRDGKMWLGAVRLDQTGNTVDITTQVWRAPE